MTILTTLLNLLSTTSPSNPPQPTTLKLSQLTPQFLSSSHSATDTPETWLVYEALFLSCLRTQDDASARLCLQRLSDRFGPDNERVMALNGLYDEATSRTDGELDEILKRYEQIITEDPTNIAIHKRLITLLSTSLSRPIPAIHSLTTLLTLNPTDAEAWMHLSHLYFSHNLYPQSIFCLEEILLIHPIAYNIFARLGEVTYISTLSQQSTTKEDAIVQGLTDSMRYYLRSIELCDDYLRGYYGLKLVTNKLLACNLIPNETKAATTKEKIQTLNQVATEKLVKIVSKARRKEKGWEGLDEAEVEAAAELLAEDEMKDVVR